MELDEMNEYMVLRFLHGQWKNAPSESLTKEQLKYHFSRIISDGEMDSLINDLENKHYIKIINSIVLIDVSGITRIERWRNRVIAESSETLKRKRWEKFTRFGVVIALIFSIINMWLALRKEGIIPSIQHKNISISDSAKN